MQKAESAEPLDRPNAPRLLPAILIYDLVPDLANDLNKGDCDSEISPCGQKDQPLLQTAPDPPWPDVKAEADPAGRPVGSPLHPATEN